MISVMLAISHVVMLSRIAHSSINTLHKIDFDTRYKIQDTRYKSLFKLGMVI